MPFFRRKEASTAGKIIELLEEKLNKFMQGTDYKKSNREMLIEAVTTAIKQNIKYEDYQKLTTSQKDKFREGIAEKLYQKITNIYEVLQAPKVQAAKEANRWKEQHIENQAARDAIKDVRSNYPLLELQKDFGLTELVRSSVGGQFAPINTLLRVESGSLQKMKADLNLERANQRRADTTDETPRNTSPSSTT